MGCDSLSDYYSSKPTMGLPPDTPQEAAIRAENQKKLKKRGKRHG